MALLFACGFNNANWNTSSITKLAKRLSGPTSSTLGAFGDGSLYTGTGSTYAYATFSIPKRTTVRFGLWFRSNGTWYGSGGAGEGQRFRLLSDNNLMCQFWIGMDNDNHPGEFAFKEYGGTTTWSGKSIAHSAWHWLEFEVVISATVGEARIWAGGVLAWEGTGLNTCGSYTAGPDEWESYVPRDNGGYIDDLVIWDTSGSVMNGQNIGAIRIRPTLVNGDGATTDWVPLNAGSNYAEVDEAISDGDTTYNTSDANGDRDELDLDTPPGNSFFGVGVHVASGREFGAGTGSMKIGIKRGASESTTTTSLDDTAGYKYCSHFTSVDPSTSAAWDDTGAAAAQAIYENAS